MHPFSQGLADAMPAARTILRGVAWIDPHDTTTSPCRLVGRVPHQLRPCRIGDGFGEGVLLEHVPNPQRFKDDQPERADELAAFLMGEFPPAIGDALVDARHDLPALDALRRALGDRTQAPLGFRQGTFIGAEEPGVVDVLTRRERGEVAQADIATLASAVRRYTAGWCGC